jgi:Helix-turn-helix.
MSELEQRQVFCANLNRILQERNLRQIDIANAIGVSPQTFNTWVSGKAIPRMGKIQALADFFGLPKSALLEKHSADYGDDTDHIQQLLQDLRDNPAIGALLSASKDLNEEDINQLAELAKRLRASYRD